MCASVCNCVCMCVCVRVCVCVCMCEVHASVGPMELAEIIKIIMGHIV